MSVAETVTNYLRSNDIAYRIISHPPSTHSADTAQAAHVPGGKLAKAVVLEDGEEFILAVVPATHRVDTDALRELLHRDVWFGREEDFALLFRDCRVGAIPPLGGAYGILTVVDDELTEPAEIYFEAGDHQHLVCLDRDAFLRATESAARGRISYRRFFS